MLTPCSTKRGQRVFTDVVAPLDRDLFDGISHIGYSDMDEALGNILGRIAHTRRCVDLITQIGKFLFYRFYVQRLISLRAKDFREKVWLNLAQHDIAVGHSQLATTAIRGRPGIGPG